MAAALGLSLFVWLAINVTAPANAVHNGDNYTLINVGEYANLDAPLFGAGLRATAPTVPDPAQHEFDAGEVAPESGIYKPQGRLRQREEEANVVRVARSLQIVHEVYFEAGELLPELTGYEAGAVWVRETAR